ncbi:MAG TPA: alpha/beta hydrolase [Chloroflexaceae bacterium]|nr:alpha/beta hydrolase [Chloroflexaceae bacterium]
MPRHAGAAARLGWGALSLALALLAVFRAPTYLLWQVAVLVTEWGHALALLALAPLLPGWRRTAPGRLGAALGVGAALLALSPLARAVGPARALPERLEAAFGLAPAPLGRPAPLVARDVLRGVPLPALAPERLFYAGGAGQELGLDYYRPSGASGPAPLVVVIHGGSWQSGDSAQLAPLNRYLAGRGYAVAAISYRLAPAWPFPAARDDVLAAVAFLKGRAAALGLDPARIVLLGRSAGGQLALLAAYSAGDPAILGAVSFYGPTDMVYGYENPSNPLVIDSRGVLEAYLDGTPATAPAAYAAASPIAFVGPAAPPTLLVHGGRDELVTPRQSERLAARLEEAGRPHLLLALPWATHGADFNLSGPFGQLSTYAVEHFLAAVTR